MKKSELAGKTITLREGVFHPQFGDMSGQEVRIEDYWKILTGKSWTKSSREGNPAALLYSLRLGKNDVPFDDYVLYGKYQGLGVLIHEVEVEDVSTGRGSGVE